MIHLNLGILAAVVVGAIIGSFWELWQPYYLYDEFVDEVLF